MSRERRVALCRCGKILGDRLDSAKLDCEIRDQSVGLVPLSLSFACFGPGRDRLIEAAGSTDIILAACGSDMHGETFRGGLESVGLPSDAIRMVDIRSVGFETIDTYHARRMARDQTLRALWDSGDVDDGRSSSPHAVGVPPATSEGAPAPLAEDNAHGSPPRLVASVEGGAGKVHSGRASRFRGSLHFLVIGAGPAGLGSAEELVARGSRVTIVDRGHVPGGRSSGDPTVQDLARRILRRPEVTFYPGHHVRELDRSEGGFRLRGSGEDVSGDRYDGVIVAIGTRAIRPGELLTGAEDPATVREGLFPTVDATVGAEPGCKVTQVIPESAADDAEGGPSESVDGTSVDHASSTRVSPSDTDPDCPLPAPTVSRSLGILIGIHLPDSRDLVPAPDEISRALDLASRAARDLGHGRVGVFLPLDLAHSEAIRHRLSDLKNRGGVRVIHGSATAVFRFPDRFRILAGDVSLGSRVMMEVTQIAMIPLEAPSRDMESVMASLGSEAPAIRDDAVFSPGFGERSISTLIDGVFVASGHHPLSCHQARSRGQEAGRIAHAALSGRFRLVDSTWNA